MSLRKSLAIVFLVGSFSLSTCGALFLTARSTGQEPGPSSTSFKAQVPGPAEPANIIRLTAAEQLGKDLFFDHTLSDPVGYSCASCHVPEAGFTSPRSEVNEASGLMPGIVPGRFGHRKPQAASYAAFSPVGPYYDDDLQVWLGGTFWDGRTPDLAAQAHQPFVDPDEMNNTPTGPSPPHAGGYSTLVARKVRKGAHVPLFRQVFGREAFATASDSDVYDMVTTAIAAWESSAEVNPFSSKYDASQFGVPASKKYKLTASETDGMNLFFGQAQCSACHSSATLAPVLAVTGGKDAFTMYCYANIGVPRNPRNPFYHMTEGASNPRGFNEQGTAFVDFGIGGNPNLSITGTPFYNSGAGDIPMFSGLFKAPSVRNVDKRPSAGFVKAYMHNGVFKSLAQVVHFYNKRNIAVDAKGNEAAFDLRNGPPAGFTPLFAPPEVLDNVQNVAGVSPANAGADVAHNGQVGNLGLTASQEADVVNFLKILSDGYTRPNPAPKP